MVLEDTIHGYEVTLDTDTEGAGDDSPDRVTGCWLIKGDQSGSLEWALAYGSLEDSEGYSHPISSGTLDQIERWAMDNGY